MDLNPSDLASKVAVNVVTEILKSSVRGLKEARAWFDQLDLFGIAAKRYVERLKDVYGTFRIFGMDRPRALRDIFVRVEILPKRTGSVHKDLDALAQALELSRRRRKSRNTFSGLELLNKPELNKVLVLGKPGAGKTTFLKYLALNAPGEANGAHKRIPVYVALREWVDPGSDLLQLICKQFEICKFPAPQKFIERMLNAGKLLLLLDGLDEVTGGRLPEASRKIRDFADEYPENQFVMSCRLAAYPYVFEKFTEVELADFDDDQIRDFGEHWFAEVAGTADLFWRTINEPANRGVLELASNPLLLTMLCLVFGDLLNFPSNRSQLYEDAIDAFLKKWDASRAIKRDSIWRQLPLDRKEDLLSLIAWNNFERGRYFIPQKDLKADIQGYIRHLPGMNEESLKPDSEAIIKAIEAQHGLLVARAAKVYSFSHLPVQEYFAARYAVEHEGQGTLARLVAEHLFKPRWREVFLLVAEMLAEADRFLLSIRERIRLQAREHGLVPFLMQLGSCILEAAPFSAAACRAIAIAEIDSIPDPALDSRAYALAVKLAVSLAADIPTMGPGLDSVIDVQACGNLTFRGEIVRLSEYLAASQLLVDCLGTEAYVSKETRNRLLEGLLDEG
jgi:hypothetical protein